MDWTIILLLLAIGAIAGILAGLLGIGGGVVIVPPLFFLLPYLGLPEERGMHVAVGTSLAATAFTTLLSTWAHHRKKSIDWRVYRMSIVGLIAGCLSGAMLAQLLAGDILRLIFGIVIILLGLYFLFPSLPFHIASSPNSTLSAFGFLIGNFSSLLGIGGGIFSLPLFLAYNVPMRYAIGTTSAATLSSVWFGSIVFMIVAWHLPAYPYTFGYIELPALGAIVLGSCATTQFGVKLAHVVSVPFLKRIFGVILMLTGIVMLIT